MTPAKRQETTDGSSFVRIDFSMTSIGPCASQHMNQIDSHFNFLSFFLVFKVLTFFKTQMANLGSTEKWIGWRWLSARTFLRNSQIDTRAGVMKTFLRIIQFNAHERRSTTWPICACSRAWSWSCRAVWPFSPLGDEFGPLRRRIRESGYSSPHDHVIPLARGFSAHSRKSLYAISGGFDNQGVCKVVYCEERNHTTAMQTVVALLYESPSYA